MNKFAGQTITKTVYFTVCAKHLADYPDLPAQGVICIFTHDPSKSDPDWILLGTQEIEFRVPDDFNPQAAAVAALQAEKAKLSAAFAMSVERINRRLSELQAIEHDEETK